MPAPGQPPATWIALALAVLGCALPAGRARADDWLVSLPPCSTRASTAPFELVYPRAGLPALVAAGDRLVARVRVPSPLTPPPGVQQPRALAGFRAELVGHAQPLRALGATPRGGEPAPPAAAFRAAPPSAARLEVRYPLEVIDLRPDGASTLLYRATIPIPAWVAPGSYDFALWAPGGQGRARLAVRVLEPGREARVAWIGAERDLENPALAALPVDVFVAAPEPAARAASSTVLAADLGAAASVPWLDLRARALALRVGPRLWVLGDCASGHAMFEHEIATALARDVQARRAPAPRPALSAGQLQLWGEPARDLPAIDAVRVIRAAERVQVAFVGDAASHAELAFVLGPGDAPLIVDAAEVSFYPAADFPARAPPQVVMRLRVAAGTSAVVLTAPRSADGAQSAPRPTNRAGAVPYALWVSPSRVHSGRPARVGVRATAGAPALHGVAFRFDALHTGFGAAAVEHAYRELGVQRVHALALGADGRAHPLSAAIEVDTARAFGCAARSAQARGRFADPDWAGWPELWAALLLLQRRRCRKPRAA